MGTALENSQAYHVLLEGRRVGPYDRRTIVGMRIKNALMSEHVLEDASGVQLTVADLIGRRPAPEFDASRSGSFSLVQAVFPASLLRIASGSLAVPRFKGEIEARVQSGVLRLAGRFRQGFGWKDGRVKLALERVVHARVVGSRVDLWLGGDGRATPLQALSLELFTPEAAGELVEWLPAASPLPSAVAAAPTVPAGLSAPRRSYGVWVALVGVAAVFILLLLLLLFRRAL